ncbi:hypothetical protein VTH82DRAFT_3239 [Thermothelomyces myriococcoides]
MTSLSPQARATIHEHWEREDSPLQQSLGKLQKILCRPITIEPEWALLLHDLGESENYPDDATSIVTIASCVQALATAMADLLADPEFREWSDTVRSKTVPQMRVFIEVAISAEASTSIWWSEQRCGLVLCLTKLRTLSSFMPAYGYREPLLKCFESRKKEQQDPRPWFMPDVASLPRPNRLFLQPPYHLILTTDQQKIELQCSHSPTLEFIAAYFSRWCRVNHQDTRKPPVVQVTLHQSAFDLGEMYDRLTFRKP